MKWIHWLYIIFLGIILSITTGFGLAAFYPEPVQPTYFSVPADIIPQNCYATTENQALPQCQKAFDKQKRQQQQFETSQKAYINANAGYTRTAVFFGIVAGSLFAVLGIGLIKTSKIITNGLLLAGVLTAILTRFLISLASMGASTSSPVPDATAYIEFFILFILSLTIIFVGLFRLKELPARSTK